MTPCFCIYILYLYINPAQRKQEGFEIVQGQGHRCQSTHLKLSTLKGSPLPMLFSSRQFVLNGHFSTTVKSYPAGSTNLKSKMKSNSPNTSLIVIVHSNFQLPDYSNPEMVSPTALFRKWLYFSLKFEIKMKRHKEKDIQGNLFLKGIKAYCQNE